MIYRVISGDQTDLGRLQSEFGVFKWVFGLMLAMSLSGIAWGIRWSGQMDARMGGLEARFDRIEDSLTKLVEQIRSKP